MNKKDKMQGKFYVYSPYDKVSKKFTGLYFANTDEEFIRQFLPSVIISTPLRDLKIYRIGIFDYSTGDIIKTTHKMVETNCYLFPHTRLSPTGEDLPLEKIEEELLKTKQEIINKETEIKEEKEEN